MDFLTAYFTKQVSPDSKDCVCEKPLSVWGSWAVPEKYFMSLDIIFKHLLFSCFRKEFVTSGYMQHSLCPRTYSVYRVWEASRGLCWTLAWEKPSVLCTAGRCLCTAVAKLLAQRYVAESPSFADWIFRVELTPLGLTAEKRSLGNCESSIIASFWK